MVTSSVKALVKRMMSPRQIFTLKYYVDKARFFGFRFKCPMCKSHLRRLIPLGRKIPVLSEKEVIGGGYRLNAQCPVCGSTDRERLLYLYLLNKTRFFSEKSNVLHVAPERELSKIIKAKSNIDYLTADISSNNVMVKMDITKIDYPDETFDVIICSHVLEHIIDDAKAMSEIHRVMKRGGWGILQVPISLSLDKTYEDYSIIDPSEREDAFGQSDHVRIYGIDYLDRLEKAGFEVDVIDWQEDLESFGGVNNKYGLLKSERVFVVNKSSSARTADHIVKNRGIRG